MESLFYTVVFKKISNTAALDELHDQNRPVSDTVGKGERLSIIIPEGQRGI